MAKSTEMSTRTESTQSHGPFGRLFFAAVRTGVRMRLRRDGKTNAQVNELMSHLDDDLIVHAAGEQKVAGVFDGGFLQWLMSHKEELMQIVETIVKLLDVFA